ncbi:MAG: hypothetical protein PHH26_00285 [Candidatus Thermoplasmatota archaeon]|nr:hypothetical protein [Candidatus Thermoplasmatota archaeon]
MVSAQFKRCVRTHRFATDPNKRCEKCKHADHSKMQFNKNQFPCNLAEDLTTLAGHVCDCFAEA